jgi:hypothetical protein
VRWIPINNSLRQLLEKMRPERPEELPDKPAMQVFECQTSIDHAAKLAGVKRIAYISGSAAFDLLVKLLV